MQIFPYYVYVIFSEEHNIYYKGYSLDPIKRLEEHNAGRSEYTSKLGTWKLVFIQGYETKKEAIIREKAIKKYSHAQLEKLILSASLNLLNRI